MQALRENEVIKEAVLVLRKTGSKPLEYLKITLKNGRVASVDLEAGNDAGASTLIERVSFTFNKIEVEYTPQGQDGQAQGRVSFVDEWGEAS
jgi:type VI secretion system secreted protein Hcp